MYASVNFLTKSEFRQAVERRDPILLYNPEQGVPAILGRVRVEGPWPGTRPPVEEIPVTRTQCGVWNEQRQCWVKLRKLVRPWHADVLVREMSVVEVVR